MKSFMFSLLSKMQSRLVTDCPEITKESPTVMKTVLRKLNELLKSKGSNVKSNN